MEELDVNMTLISKLRRIDLNWTVYLSTGRVVEHYKRGVKSSGSIKSGNLLVS